MASVEVVVALAAPPPSVLDSAIVASKKRPIQIAHTKKPLFFYVNLAKRRFQEEHEIELSALGNAISTAVKVSEILKNTGIAILKDIDISSVPIENKILGRMVPKARILIVLEKTEKSETLIAETVSNLKTDDSADKDGSPKGPLTSDGDHKDSTEGSNAGSTDGDHRGSTDGDNKNPTDGDTKEQ